MTFSSILTDYLGQGPASSEPGTLDIAPTALGLYYRADTQTLRLWNGTAFVTILAGQGVSEAGPGIDINSGTISLGTIAPGLLGVSGTTAAVPGPIAIGTNLSLTADGTLNATGGGGGGTLAIASAGTVLGNATELDFNNGSVTLVGTVATFTAPTGSGSLAGDSDVDLTSPATGQALVYDGTASMWKNTTLQLAPITVSPATLPASTVWDATHKSASVTLSTDALTASVANPVTNTFVWSTASTASLSAGKVYWEAVINCAGHATTVGLGTTSVDQFSGGTPGGGACAITVNDGIIWVDGGFSPVSGSGSLGASVIGKTVSMAADITNKLMWFRANGGDWNADPTADPATGAGGIDFSFVFEGPPFFPICTLAQSQTGSITCNFGATPFAFTPPAGFSAVTAALIADVDVASPTDGQTLVYNATAGVWKNVGRPLTLLDPIAVANTTASSSAFAFKGQSFSINVGTIVVSSLVANFGSLVSGGVYQGAVFVASQSPATITSVVSLTSAITATSTAAAQLEFPFPADITLNKGTFYAAVIGRTDATGTTSVSVTGPTVVSSFFNWPNTPGNTVRIAATTITAGGTYDTNSSSKTPFSVTPLFSGYK